MSFEDDIKDYVKTIEDKLEYIDTEETTKIALINPFIRLLGYDTTNPSIVRAEYTADVGVKQGAKVDFAILENEEPIIFIECKSVNKELTSDNISQLYRYFSITDIQIGILTNGIDYKFFTTGIDNNRMDEKPFLDINLLNLNKKDIVELAKFKKSNFDVEKIVSRADYLKYRNLIKKTLLLEFENPTNEFIKTIGNQVYEGRLTPNIKKMFGDIIPIVISEIINERINKTLNDAVASNEEEQEDNNVVEDGEEINNESGIITTTLEKEGYFIVKAIASEVSDSNRITIRNRKNYCNVLFDNNQRFPIVRLHFNNENNLKVEFYDEFKTDERGVKKGNMINITNVSELYDYKDKIIQVVGDYIKIRD